MPAIVCHPKGTMPLRRKIVLSLLVLTSFLWAWQILRIHAAKQQRQKREAAYAATAAELRAAIKPGMPRVDAEAILKGMSRNFARRSGSRTWDDIIPLAHEPSPSWYCNSQQVQVLLAFSPAETSPAQRPISPAGYQPLPNDRVTSVALDRWLQDCL